jgi:peptidyl-prolyl cis-trans isomerase SurA
MISLMISRKVVVTKDEIAAYYEANKAQFSGQRYADFSVIVFNPSVKAQGIYDQLKSGSISFDEAARQYSVDATGKNGGYVGRVPWSNIPPGLQNVLAATSEGGLTPLITSEGKTAVFRLNSMGEGRAVSLEEASDRIEELLKEPRMQERFVEYTQQLRSKAVVDIRI